ncbi:MAG: deoxynucleoside kinase [candidate division WOR-3 bacterium]|nr:MAG: deoxynucleoside kinase [candidate division WOR-3 bacterium]
MNYIAVEGVIGVGKTALAERLATRLDARLVLEEIEENPFIDRFYQDIRAHAFQTQLFFLLSRHKQQQELRQTGLFEQAVVSDYLFEKDRVFAALNLSEHEMSLYDKIYRLLVKDIAKPDVVVYLQARTDVVMSRIRQRGRPFEAAIEPEYLDSLSDAYNHFFMHYDATPVLIVNTERLDFVANNEDFEELLKAIQTTNSGRRFYSPRGKGR